MNRGFTLIEIIVTISIMVLLTSILLVYSRTSERQIILFKEQARVVNTVLRAKSLAIQTFAAKPEDVCGYGVNINYSDQTFILFKETCSSNDRIYSGANSGEALQTEKLDAVLKFKSESQPLNNIVFLPPEPKTVINNNPGQTDAAIIIETLDSAASRQINVNNAGQVTTK